MADEQPGPDGKVSYLVPMNSLLRAQLGDSLKADDELDVPANPLPVAQNQDEFSAPWGFFNSSLAQSFRIKNLLTNLSPISAVHPGTSTQPPLIDWQVPPLAQELYRQVTNVGGALRGRNPITDQTLSDVTSLAGMMASPSVAMEAEPGTLAAFNAWHGSPATFAKTEIGHPEFLDEKMGTGEGAQAYGWGHYSAEKQGTARSYRGPSDRQLGFGDYSPDELKDIIWRPHDDRVFDETLDPALRDPLANDAILSVSPKSYYTAEEAQKYMVPTRIKSLRDFVANEQENGYISDKVSLKYQLQRAQERFENAVNEQLGPDEEAWHLRDIDNITKELQKTPEEWAASKQPFWNIKLGIADWLEQHGDRLTIHDPTSLYRTAILPDEDQLLHLDLPLASQPEAVKAALRGMPDEVWDAIGASLRDKSGNYIAAPLSKDSGWDINTGNDLRNYMERSRDVTGAFPDVMANGHEKTPFIPFDVRNYKNNPNAKNVSKYLDSIGIPGSMFFDNKSRAAGQKLADYLTDTESDLLEPKELLAYDPMQEKAKILDQIYGPESDLTHNYIMFDPKNQMITHRNGTRLVPGEYEDAAKAFEYQDLLHRQAGLAPPTRLFPVKGDPFNPLTGPQPNLLTGTGQ